MHKPKYLYLFISLFFLLSFSNVNAFTQFNTNPNFDSTYFGVYVLNQCNPVGGSVGCNWFNPFTWLTCLGITPTLNTAFDVSYNSTGSDASGILLLNPSSNCTWTGDANDILLNIKMLNGSEYFNSKEVPAGNSSWTFEGNKFTLPKNQEGIIFLRWKTNSTTDFSYSDSILQWYDSLGASNSTFFSGSWTNWVDTTLLIPANIYEDREINIFMSLKIASASEPIQIMIDRFSFYTYDLIQPRTSYFTSFANENTTYCGNAKTQVQFLKENQILNLALMISNNTNDNNLCCAFQSGNFTIVRRCIPHATGGTIGEYEMRDLALVQELHSAEKPFMLIKKLSTTSITYDFYQRGYTCYATNATCNWGASSVYNYGIGFNGNGGFWWTCNNVTLGLTTCGSDKVNAVMDLSILSSYITGSGLSGNKFGNIYQQGGLNYGYISLPNFQYITSYICTCTDGIELCTDETGSIVSTDCGDYGCDSAGQYCNLPSIVNTYGYGTFCYKTINPITTNTRGYIFYNSTTASGVYGTCALDEYCYQYNTNSIMCKNIVDNTTTTYIDSNGQNTTIPSEPTTNPTLGTNIFGYTALAFGSLFGMGDISFLQIDIAMFSIFMAIFFAGTISMGLAIKQKEFSEKIFGYVFIGFLSIFTFGMGNIYLYAIYAVIVILTAGIMTGYFKRLFGGN